MASHKSKDKQDNDLIILSHQLQGPLHASIGRISFILGDENLSLKVRQNLEFTNALLLDMLEFTFGFMVASQITQGKAPFLGEDKVNVLREAESIAERIFRTSNRPDVKFEFIETDKFRLIQIDRRLFESVLHALLHNAVKYADKESTVRIGCTFSSTTPSMEVLSIGSPIPESEREQIFEKFYVGSNNMHGSPSGTGLGLWIARTIMRALGGEVTLKNLERHKRSAVFKIHFPRKEAENYVPKNTLD
jgi:two-component system, OmpR family, sensor histidine kinase KdpD